MKGERVGKWLVVMMIVLVFVFASCGDSSTEHAEETFEFQAVKSDSVENNAATVENTTEEIKEISALEETMQRAGLVDIQSVDSTIQVDVKYATTDNFMGRVLYANYSKVYLQPEVAQRLAKVQEAIKSHDSRLSLLVFDGARPRSVQQLMWDALDTLPIAERVKFVSNPKNGSIHNYGSAVDLTIFNGVTGEWLDMGAGYDDLRKIAYPRHEDYYLERGELTQEQVDNRKFLRKMMRVGGFWVIETEWWHFNAFSRDKAKELFEPIE